MAAYDAFNPEGPTEQPGTGYAPQPANYLTYDLLGTDPSGKAVYRGSDGNMYTDGNGPNGFVPYSGPGVGAPPTAAGTDTTPAPPPTTSPGGGAPPSMGGGAFDPFPGGQFNYTPGQFGGSSSGSSGYPSVPTFTAPTFVKPPQFSYDKFTAPTFEQAQQTPGYEFRLKEGERALQNAAAGKGILRTGGTLKDLLQYGQNYATNAYNDVYGRSLGEYKLGLDTAMGAYKTNWGVESDAYQNLLDAAKTSYTGQLAGYQNQYQSAQRGNELDYSRAWEKYLQDVNMWQKERDWKYNVLSGERGAGFNAAST